MVLWVQEMTSRGDNLTIGTHTDLKGRRLVFDVLVLTSRGDDLDFVY